MANYIFGGQQEFGSVQHYLMRSLIAHNIFFHNITHQTYEIMYFISLICGCVIGVVAAFVYEHRSIQRPKKTMIIEILAVIILNVLTTDIFVLTYKLAEMFQIHINRLS